MTADVVSDVLQWIGSVIISHLLTFTLIFLSLMLLHDALSRSKTLNLAWPTLVGRNHPPSPPGPWWNLPMLGYLPWLGDKPYVTMWKLSHRYGNVYQIRLGSRRVVVLNGRETIKAAFIHQGDSFAGRPDFPSFASFSDGHSLAFTSLDTDWTTQRKVALRVLGTFTDTSKHPIEALINRHAVALADRLLRDSACTRRAVDPFSAIESAVVAILFEVCFGAAGDGDQSLYAEMIQMLHEMRAVMPAVQSVDFMPWLAPFFHGSLQRHAASLRRSHQLTRAKIDAVVSSGVPGTPTCIVHALHHAYLTKLVNDVDGTQRARIMTIVEDLIGAGSETVAQFVHWVILYAAKYPDIVQQRVRGEIERTIGWTSTPEATDRGRMPYTEACLWEIMRHGCLAPMSLPHSTLSDVVIAGCRVPAGTTVFANFYSTGWDPDVWGDPTTFRPERFLKPDGSQVDHEMVKQFMCFGTGRRRCPGAQFGTLEMFIFFVVLMQRCSFSAPHGRELSTDGNFVRTNRAKEYEVHVQPAAAANDGVMN